MDDVPYEFVERVFAKLSCRAVTSLNVPAPLWHAVARAHKRRLRRYICVIQPSENDGLVYGFVRYGMRSTEKAVTLEEYVKLDWRYHRVVAFRNQFKVERMGNFHPVGDRLPAIVALVSQFNLDMISVEKSALWYNFHDLELRVLDECCKHEMMTKALEIHCYPGYDVFLLKQLESDRLEQLYLYRNWDERIRPRLEAFVCRPNLKRLISPRFQCFDHEGIQRIVNYWRSMDAPWEGVRIEFGASRRVRDEIGDELASWMERIPNPRPHSPKIQQFVEVRGQFKVVVEKSYDSIIISFHNIGITK